MSDIWNLVKWVVGLILGHQKEAKADKLRLEQEAWKWLERHLPYFEEQAKSVYAVVLQNSAEKVPLEFPDEQFPFVEKLSRFPIRKDNALNRNFRRLEMKERQKAWAISNDYVEKWNNCMSKFPQGEPDLPPDLIKFEKVRKALHGVIEKA